METMKTTQPFKILFLSNKSIGHVQNP